MAAWTARAQMRTVIIPTPPPPPVPSGIDAELLHLYRPPTNRREIKAMGIQADTIPPKLVEAPVHKPVPTFVKNPTVHQALPHRDVPPKRRHQLDPEYQRRLTQALGLSA